MRSFFIILLVTLAKTSLAQGPGDYYDIPELKRVHILNDFQLSGTFKCEMGIYESVTLKLDSARTFNSYLHSCDGNEFIDSGSWKFNGFQIALRGVKGNYNFDILQFDQYYVLVYPEDKEQFIKEMKAILKKIKGATVGRYDFPGEVFAQLDVIVYVKKIRL